MKLKLEHKLILGGILSFALPVIVFGKFDNILSYILFPFICLSIYASFKYKSKRQYLQYLLVLFFMGFFMGEYKIALFSGADYEKTVSHISIFGAMFGWNNLAYSMVIPPFIYCYLRYESYQKELKEKEFNYDRTRISRDDKIDNIIGKW